jgi:hypothetical protein
MAIIHRTFVFYIMHIGALGGEPLARADPSGTDVTQNKACIALSGEQLKEFEIQTDPNILIQTMVQTSISKESKLETPNETKHDDDGAIRDKEDPPQVFDEIEAGASSSDYVWLGSWNTGGNYYTWGDRQCPLLETLPGLDLEACKVACHAKTGCHAINLHHKKCSKEWVSWKGWVGGGWWNKKCHGAPNVTTCELRECSQPVVTPHVKRAGWGSWFMHVHKTVCDSCDTLLKLDDGGHICESGEASPADSRDPVPHSYWWDRKLPRIGGCWPDIGKGKLKQFKFAIKLDKTWADHYNEHKEDFARHNYKTLAEAPRLLLEPVSYLFEQQFGVQLVPSAVAVMDKSGKYKTDPWRSGDAGTILFHTLGGGGSAVGAVCQNLSLSLGELPFTEDGKLRVLAIHVLLHELGHYFGSHHVPEYKPDLMTVRGSGYRRCAGKLCRYSSFLPWQDATWYRKTICVSNIQTATCARLVDEPKPTTPQPKCPAPVSWIIGGENQDCNAACVEAGGSCSEAQLSFLADGEYFRAVAKEAGRTCRPACTGNFHDEGRPPAGTPCISACKIESGYWGKSWCSVGAAVGSWGAPCTSCSSKSSSLLNLPQSIGNVQDHFSSPTVPAINSQGQCTTSSGQQHSCATKPGQAFSRLCPCKGTKICATHHMCPDGYDPNPFKSLSTTLTDANCCQKKRASCTEFPLSDCPSGKLFGHANIAKCQATTCTKDADAQKCCQPLPTCTGYYRGKNRPPAGTKCTSECKHESGYWGESWCNTETDSWGAPCTPCS